MRLTRQELTVARGRLEQAATIIASLRGAFLVAGFTEGAQRMNDIGGRIADAIQVIDKAI